jgi:hypothetical protein
MAAILQIRRSSATPSLSEGELFLNQTSETLVYKAASSNVTLAKLDSANTGTFTATSIVETSALKYKENIVPIENSLEAIKKLKGVKFNLIGNEKTQIGFIADDVENIIPEIVTKDKNGEIEGLEYSRLTALLVEAVKELSEKIDSLNK